MDCDRRLRFYHEPSTLRPDLVVLEVAFLYYKCGSVLDVNASALLRFIIMERSIQDCGYRSLKDHR